MRVAAIYDIHGNLPALEAVLDAIRAEGVDRIVVGGDVVPGPMPRESVSTLLDLPTPVRFIHGNGESDILALHRGERLARVPEAFHHIMRWVLEELSPEHLSAFATWPLTSRLDVPGLGNVLFCHATPRDDNEIFTRLTREDRLRPVFEGTNANVVICGHTHMQFDRRVGDVRVLNAGSVGLPFGSTGAHWVLLESGTVQLRSTPYDLDAAVERIRATTYPSEIDLRRPPPEPQMLEVFEKVSLT